MKITVDLKVIPFKVPNTVVIDTGKNTLADIVNNMPIEMLDAYTLDRLCREFTNSVFKKAGKERPPMCATERGEI